MKKIEVDGKIIHLDEEGFLIDSEDWNYQVAHALASNLGMTELDEEQVEVIDFLRSYYHRYKAFPILNYLSRYVEQPLEYLNREYVNPMDFCRIAGLPKPEGINFVALDGKNYQLEERY